MMNPHTRMHTGWLEAEGSDLLTPPDEPVPAVTDPTPFGSGDGWRSAGPSADAVHIPTRVIGGRLFARELGHTWEVIEPDPFDRVDGAGPSGDHVISPMPATVLAIDVTVGESVVAGQRLGALEAMKMELALHAPHDGVVTEVGAAAGDQVKQGHVIVTVTAHE
jgi:biotin carboxyl carrier protein